jgi:Flp pilus assembly protein TadD
MGSDSPTESPPHRCSPLVAAGVAVVLVGAAAVYWWFPRKPSPPTPAPVVVIDDEPDIPLPVAANPGYLGPQSCASCHAKRVAEFLRTNHAHAARRPDPATMPPGFAPGRGTIPTREPGLRFEMTRTGDDFFQNAVRNTPAGEKRDALRIGLVYGGGRLDEVNFAWVGDRMYELPAAWLYPLDTWGLSSTYRHDEAGAFAREATTGCLGCHTTWFSHVAGTPNQYVPDSFLLGVTCERCHGPGREHVAFHQANPKADAAKIVHPGKLPRERQLDVCAQCHSNAVRARGPVFSYRPGKSLADAYRSIDPKYPEEDHVANQVKYLKESKCFQKSDLTCTTCHDPHRPHAPADPGAARNGCASCHKPADCREQPRLPEPVRGDCAGCHMPPRVWMNVNFHTADDRFVPPIRRYDHRIAIYPEARDEVLRNFYKSKTDDASKKEVAKLSESLVKFWLAEADRRRQQYRFLAAIGAGREALRVDPSPAVREKLREAIATQDGMMADFSAGNRALAAQRFPEAIDLYKKVLATKPDFAIAHGKLGTAYAYSGQMELAEKELKAVAELDPDESYGNSMLGWLALQHGDPAAAAEHYRKAEELEPFTANLSYFLGLSRLRLAQFADAEASFRRTLLIDPRHAGAWQGLSHALRKVGKATEAVSAARKAAKLSDYKHPDVLLSLADAYADAGKYAEAAAAAEKGLAAARAAGDPAQVSHLRRRFEELRAKAAAP